MMPNVLVENFPVSVGVFLGVVAAAIGIFVFSMPMLRSPIDRTMLDAAKDRHYSTADVRRAFDLRGLALPTARTAPGGVTLSGGAAGLTVLVAARPLRAVPAGGGFRARVGNVLVRYRGRDQDIAAQVKAAVAALRG